MAYLRGGEISAVRIATKTGNPMAATEYRDERGVVHSVVAFGPVALKLITLAGQRVSMDGRWDVDGKRGTRFIADFVEPGSGHVVPEYAMPVPKSLSHYKEQQSPKPEAPAPFQVVPTFDPRGDTPFSRKPEASVSPVENEPIRTTPNSQTLTPQELPSNQREEPRAKTLLDIKLEEAAAREVEEEPDNIVLGTDQTFVPTGDWWDDNRIRFSYKLEQHMAKQAAKLRAEEAAEAALAEAPAPVETEHAVAA